MKPPDKIPYTYSVRVWIVGTTIWNVSSGGERAGHGFYRIYLN